MKPEDRGKKEIGHQGQPASTKEETGTLLRKKTVFLPIILIIVLGFTLYGNSLGGKFIWDDEFLVEDNLYIKNFSHLPKIFTGDIGTGGGYEYNFYRPLQMLTYTIDYSLYRLDVRGYHLTSILLHIFVALAIFWLVNILMRNPLLALFTSIFFIVHPVHTEAVAYISGRADPLALLFLLLSFIFYVKNFSSKGIAFYSLALISYTLALLSRENSLILPLLLLLYHYSFKRRVRLKQFLPILGLTFTYILLRVTVLSFPASDSRLLSTTLFQRLPGFFAAITNYTRLVFLPLNLHMEYGDKLFNFTDPRVILGIIILISLLVYTLRIKQKNTLIFFSLSWFLITILPVSNLYPLNAYMAEHWLYLPSIGLFLLLANGLRHIYNRQGLRILTIVFTVSLLTFYSYLTLKQNTYWREPLAFYERTLKYAPQSYKMYNNLGVAYFALNRKEEAITSYEKALQINPDLTGVYNNLGVVYSTLNRKEEAITSYKKAIEINPDYAEAYYNLGIVYSALNRREEAIISYKKAIQINPKDAKAYNNLGNTYSVLKRRKEAITTYKKAIEINPDYADAYYNLGSTYSTLNKDEEAIALYKKVLQINPDYAKAYNNLSATYFRKKQYELAVEYFDRAKELGFANPAFLEALKPYR